MAPPSGGRPVRTRVVAHPCATGAIPPGHDVLGRRRVRCFDRRAGHRFACSERMVAATRFLQGHSLLATRAWGSCVRCLCRLRRVGCVVAAAGRGRGFALPRGLWWGWRAEEQEQERERGLRTGTPRPGYRVHRSNGRPVRTRGRGTSLCHLPPIPGTRRPSKTAGGVSSFDLRKRHSAEARTAQPEADPLHAVVSCFNCCHRTCLLGCASRAGVCSQAQPAAGHAGRPP